jgi:hypothetical protein
MIMNSVFRLAARRTGLSVRALRPKSAPVSEKRIGLSRSPRRRGSVANFLGGYVAHGYDGLYPANE